MYERRMVTCGSTARPWTALVLLAVALLLPVAAGAQTTESDLSSLSVDDLMNLSVTSVSRIEEKFLDSAAAIFVITRDDIRRSGATNIPDLLRMVPGFDVAQINRNSWAVSARGSNGLYANKLLVMIDGRSIYKPLFSGVFWDVQEATLEDIDRIEVIRGPGGTLWGANAVNGIVNIITRHSVETTGQQVSATYGSENGATSTLRAGGSRGPDFHYRFHARSMDRPESIRDGVERTNDALSMERGGFRLDWNGKNGDVITASGEVYRGSEGSRGLLDPSNPYAGLNALNRLSGQSVQFQWSRVQSSRSDTMVRFFYDHLGRKQPSLELKQQTLDGDFQQQLRFKRHQIIWGAGYRYSTDQVTGYGARLERDTNATGTTSAFLQDEFQVSRRLRLTAGSKVLYDRVNDVQFQPSVRLTFKATERQTMWFAATRAIRTPSEIELYSRINVAAYPDGRGGTVFSRILGNETLEPERIFTLEGGYRWIGRGSALADFTVFHTRSRGLVDSRLGAPFGETSGVTIFPIALVNSVRTRSSGFEVLASASPKPRWQLTGGYTLFTQSITDSEHPLSNSFTKPSVPRHQLQFRSARQLGGNIEVSVASYYVGNIGNDVDSYVRLDSRLAWRTGRWQIALTGQNLQESQHMEFVGVTGESVSATPVRRNVAFEVSWTR